MRRLRLLAGRFTTYLGMSPVRIYPLLDAHDPSGDVMGMYWRSKRAIFIRTRSSYRRKRKRRFTPAYLRGILTHELAHLLGPMGHGKQFKRNLRKVSRILRKLETEL